jgi:DNA-binding CsgD family transcriptional regulator
MLLPLVKKMGDRGSDLDKDYLRLLEENIAQLTSSFGSKICHLNQRLTPRESEICNMIRAGLGSKEIGKMLNISYRSVETYRNHIRKKLGITNKKINLTSYLSGL